VIGPTPGSAQTLKKFLNLRWKFLFIDGGCIYDMVVSIATKKRHMETKIIIII